MTEKPEAQRIKDFSALPNSQGGKSEVINREVSDSSEAPKAKDIFYRCTECGVLVSSVPKENGGCQCGNIFIDIDYFRLAVRDYSKFEAVKKLQ